MLQYLAVARTLGQRLLRSIALAFELNPAALAELLTPDPYLLLKLMRYTPRTPQAAFSMAPHCDFSLLTLVVQSGDGLQIRTPRGQWLSVPALPNTISVNLGELLEVVSAGRMLATPHRVVVDSSGTRLSLPVFINPDLKRVVAPARNYAQPSGLEPPHELQHVHRVLPPATPYSRFTFGDKEWDRKGLGRWCHDERCWRDH
jgi:isopenicillin N synthase-like dioxygenase